jgi:hypothetical protein
MATVIPKDLEKHGKCEFKSEFTPHTISVGQICRKCGPVDAIKTKAVMLQGYLDYDGGIMGVSAFISELNTISSKIEWSTESYSIAGSYDSIMAYFKTNGYSLAT